MQKNLTYLSIRQLQTINALRRLSARRQIACRKEHAPQIIYRTIQLIICQIKTQAFLDRAAVKQQLQLIFSILISLSDKMLHQLITARIHPKGLRLCSIIKAQLIGVVDNIPRTINFSLAKAIAVIPFLHHCSMLLKRIISHQAFHLRWREAKIFLSALINNGVNRKIVKSGKNAFLRNSQAACQHCPIKIAVRFQRLA